MTDSILLILLFIGLFVAVFGLSSTAYQGGFHLGCLRALQRAKALDEFVMKSGDAELIIKWNEYLKAVNVENNKTTYTEWLLSYFKKENK